MDIAQGNLDVQSWLQLFEVHLNGLILVGSQILSCIFHDEHLYFNRLWAAIKKNNVTKISNYTCNIVLLIQYHIHTSIFANDQIISAIVI